MTSLCAVVVGLACVTAVEAGGKGNGGGNKGSSGSYKMSSSNYKMNSSNYKMNSSNYKMNSSNYKSSKYYCYKNCYKCDWSCRCWCGSYGCWLFYDPCYCCNYYWYSPSACWYPEAYIATYPPVAGEAAPAIADQIPEGQPPANGNGPVVTSGPSQATNAIKTAATKAPTGDTEAR